MHHQDTGKPLHAGHRERLRNRAIKEGIDGFADHEILELLLFLAIPRRNTNPIAHHLLRRFGTLSAVLDAAPHELVSVGGIGPQGAASLSLIPQVMRRYLEDKRGISPPRLSHFEAVGRYLLPLMAGRTREVVYMLCLDSHCQVRFPALLTEGTGCMAQLHPRLAVETALRHQADSVILAHNHPSGIPTPSAADRHLTGRIAEALGAIGIPLLDHIIVANTTLLSFEKEGLMPVPRQR